MAFDGVVISNIVYDLKEKLTGGRIYKIYQPENDELNIVIKNNKDSYRLMLSADASLPLIYILGLSKENPMSAPNFCMLLRKHIGNGRIIDVMQPGFERIVEFTIEHLDEMGDVCRKKLIIEIMGKHSNIIFTDHKGMIIDSIKHVSHLVSSVREVLPGRRYEYPPDGGKINPMELDRGLFDSTVMTKTADACKAIYTSLSGFSPVVANEICYRADIDPRTSVAELGEGADRLYKCTMDIVDQIKRRDYDPVIVFDGYKPVEFSSVMLTMYSDKQIEHRNSISELLDEYYYRKALVTRMRQKSTDLRRIVQTAIERTSRKYDLQMKQLKDTENREKYKVYGELINTYGYSVKQGEKSFKALNYYTNEMVTIPLDPTKTPQENAQRYFDKYNKQKRTFEALSRLIEETKEDIDYLESVQNALFIAQTEDDLAQVKEELIDAGYMRRKFTKKKIKIKSQPLHYISSDGYHMYVGKNNFQNEELTFHFAVGNDWWFHAKQAPGSHVIVKTNGDELPDRTFEEAGKLAAYYSSMKDKDKIEIDYVEKKHVKKPRGGKPGFVVYYTNYSLIIDSDISGIQLVE